MASTLLKAVQVESGSLVLHVTELITQNGSSAIVFEWCAHRSICLTRRSVAEPDRAAASRGCYLVEQYYYKIVDTAVSIS